MNTNGSIRSQILKTVLILGVSMAVLLGAGFFVLFDAKDPLTSAVREYNQHRELLFTIRLSLDRTDTEFRLVYANKPEAAKAYLESASAAATELTVNLDRLLASRNSWNADMHREIKKFRNELVEAQIRERDQAELYAKGKIANSESHLLSITNSFEERRKKLEEIKERVLIQIENQLVTKLQGIVFLIIPIIIGLFVIPVPVIWGALRRINRDLIGYVRSLYDLSEQNEKNSERLKTASELVSTASSQQSAAIQQTSSSITEIRSMLVETEKRVREVQSLTTEMDLETTSGREIMQKLERSMQTIEETNRQIESFEEILNQIQAKTHVINDIVFKTQLLSFNASIEAARAGQYGRGFSVVAEEVGKLAMMSGDAAREIDQLLGQSAERVSRIVGSVNEKVRDGKNVSQVALAKFSDLATKLSSISFKVDQVAHATTEQAGGIEQTARAMEQVNLGATENKRGAEEVHQIADLVFELSATIREVSTGIRRFVREHPGEKRSSERRARTNIVTTSTDVLKKVVSFERKKTPAKANLDVQESEVVSEEKVIAVGGQRPTRVVSADDPSFKKAGKKNVK